VAPVKGAYHEHGLARASDAPAMPAGKSYLPSIMSPKQVLQYQYHYDKGNVKTTSLVLGNRHDAHIPCSPSYQGHVPGYQTSDDVSHTRGSMVRSMAAAQRAPVAHGEPVFYPGSTQDKMADHVPVWTKTIVKDTVPGLTTRIEPNPNPLPFTMRKQSTLGGTRQVKAELMRVTQPLCEPTGPMWSRRNMKPWQQAYYPRGPTRWEAQQSAQEIHYGFETARSYAGCGRC